MCPSPSMSVAESVWAVDLFAPEPGTQSVVTSSGTWAKSGAPADQPESKKAPCPSPRKTCE